MGDDTTSDRNMDSVGKGRPVLVVGAGFSGLAVAHHLSRAGFIVELREASDHAGGLIATRQTPRGPVETAANGMLNSRWVEDLFSAAGVEMIPTRKEARARYIVRDGRARRWPLTLRESLTLLGCVFRFLFARRTLAPRVGETVVEWGGRVLSPSISRYTIETALQGIYAGDPRRMSASLIFGRLFSSARESKPKCKLRFRGTVAPRGGMGELIRGLRQHLEKRGVRIHIDKSVRGEELASEERPVVLTTGLAAAAELLKQVDPERARALASQEMVPVVTVTAYFPLGSSPLRGFGCLFPPGEGHGVLGVLMNNWIFTDRAVDCLAETWILGGALQSREQVEALSDSDIRALIYSERRALFKHDAEPLDLYITRWPRALPHYTVAMETVVAEFRVNRKNIFLLGNYTGGIGLAKILEQAAALPQVMARDGNWRNRKGTE